MLAAAGFVPKLQTWADLDATLLESATAGVAICKPGLHGEIDLHLRPLPNIFDVSLTHRIISAAEQATLQGRKVLIPTSAHHLFLALARCEPWDSTESFLRLLEGYFLMARSGEQIDWRELLSLVDYYALQSIAFSYLSTLERESGLPVPPEILKQLEASETRSGRVEWTLRRVHPARLSPLQNRTLMRREVQSHRAKADASPPGYVETLLSYSMRTGIARPLLSLMWQLARRRFRGEATGRPRFLHGFSYPETGGRWTNARYAVVALPLTEAQKRGEQVRLNAHLFRPKGRRASVMATAGDGTATQTIEDEGDALNIAVRCRSLPSLGGDALLLLFAQITKKPCVPSRLSCSTRPYSQSR